MSREEQIMKGNLKLSVFDSFPYQELKKVIEAIEQLHYTCEFCDNGNIIFQKKEKRTLEEEFSAFINKHIARANSISMMVEKGKQVQVSASPTEAQEDEEEEVGE